MRHCKNLSTLICLLTLILVYQTSDAQQDLAQQAYAIFEQNCLNCHGPGGAFTEEIIIEHTALIETGAVVPGKLFDSELFQRIWTNDPTKRMPSGQPQLPTAAIQTIANWIQAGAPNWEDTSETDRAFITPEEMLETIEDHINLLPAFDRSFARYFTLTHLYNAGETIEALHTYQRALSKLVNSLSWGRDVAIPQPIDMEETIFYIDLRDYEWESETNKWTQIEENYPYSRNFTSPTYTTLRHEMECEVPFIRADWFIATASLPPLYHGILDLPGTDTELEARLEVNVAKNLENAPGRRVWRAGFNNSGVSENNRIVERHQSRYGAYWKSYDFSGSVGTQNIFRHPLDFKHAGGEIIFNLPNGLQAYYISDASGNRIDAAPTDIVSDPGVGGPKVRNGLSCMGCHTEGMRDFEDEVRLVVEQNPDPPYDKAQALRLYAEKVTMDTLVDEDRQRYKQAIEKTGGILSGSEPIQQLARKFEGLLDADHAAAEVGLETNDFLKKIKGEKRLRDLGLPAVESSGIQRETWELSQFGEVISMLDSYQENTPDGPNASLEVFMPDANLRAAVRSKLGLEQGDILTQQRMLRLEQLGANSSEVRSLIGLEHATNLKHLSLYRNKISDITPLTNLTNLRSLSLHTNKISDITPLTNLTNLQQLHLDYNEISDLSPLANLTTFTGRLTLEDNKISDLSPLANLTGIEDWLDLRDNEISDLSPLANLTSLTHLYIDGNKISDLSPLANLTSLTQLFIGNNKISNIIPLKDLTAITYLKLDSNQINDITPLTNLTAISVLDIENNKIDDSRPLANLTALSRLFLNDNQIKDITHLKNLTSLDWLYLYNNQIIDVTPLENLADLGDLLLENNRISDVTPLENLTSLHRLWLKDNPIADFAPLRRLKEKNPDMSIDIDINADINNVQGAPSAPVLPAETALLSNYPNPFNPDTWIPYQLAKAAEVTVTIYDVKGMVVRQLALGHQPVGFYQNRPRAAYWDGRNVLGEPVASGVYFYTLKAGEFTATRKMLIRK